MDDNQKQQLAQHIRSNTDPLVSGALAIGNDTEIARLYNLPTTFVVWKTNLSRHDILTATSDEGTTFAWAGGAYITRSQGERDAFREMFNSTGSVDPTKATIQAAFNDIFSGTGGAGNRAHILAMSKRKCNLFERVFATGTGTTATPGRLTVEGEVGVTELSESLRRF